MKRSILALAATAVLIASFAAGSPPVARDNTPIAPAIPAADRHDASKVFLEHADELRSSANTDFQVLVGDVAFRRDGMYMWCDSAHFYDATGSFDAFGNVRMQQGDTLFIYGDTLKYDEPTKIARLLASPGKLTRLVNRDVTLTTAEFNYDLGLDLGYYEVGGTLVDKSNRLTSLEGEYSPTTKEAVFRENVRLTSLSKEDTLKIFTDNLYYNTLTHVALLVAPSTVVNRDGIIVTSNGSYNTESTQAELFDHSTVTYKNGNTLTGDTLYYNRQTGLGEAFGNVEINDTTNHVILYGEYGYAFEPADSAYVTRRARAIEYSTSDSLFLHGDTIRTHRIINRHMVKKMIPDTVGTNVNAVDTLIGDSEKIMNVEILADSVANANADSIAAPTMIEVLVEQVDTIRFLKAFPRVRFFRSDLQGLCDSMTMVSTDSMLYMDRFPLLWSDNRQISGDQIKVHFNDSTADNATVTRNAFIAEHIEDVYFNQLAGKEMYAIFKNRALSHLDVSGNVQIISFPEENDSTINKMMEIESSYLSADFTEKNFDIKYMKLWPETNATVTPLYLSKRSQLYLHDFKWLEQFRPLSPDDIFNFSDELLDAMKNAETLTQSPQPWKQTDTPKPSSTSSTPQPATSLQPTPSVESSTGPDSPDSISPTDGISRKEDATTSRKIRRPSSHSSSVNEEPMQATE